MQSHTEPERQVYLRDPMELCLQTGFVVRVVKPLYGIQECGLHWYLTCLSHHLEKLIMSCTGTNPCALLTRNGNNLIDGIILLQVED